MFEPDRKSVEQGWAHSGPRATYGPPQRFQWPAETLRKNLQIWKFPSIYHSKCWCWSYFEPRLAFISIDLLLFAL